MAFIPRPLSQIRNALGEPAARIMSGTGAGGGGAPSMAGGGTEPGAARPAAGGRFAALQGFLSANMPNVEAAAAPIVQGIEGQAQSAVDTANQSRSTYASMGGAEMAARAQGDRDDALGKLNASETTAGLGELLGSGRGSDYTSGMKAADAALYGRSSALRAARERWQPVLEALEPTYWRDPVPAPNPYADLPSAGLDGRSWRMG